MIEAYGGVVINKRVIGELGVSRSFGDFLYKEMGVHCHPDTCRIKITEEISYLIVASDGIWDMLTNQEVADVIQSKFMNLGDNC